MKQYYTGKLALVTGGASGIGKSLSEELSAQGANVIVTDIDVAGAELTAGSIIARGGKSFPYQLDVSDGSMVNRLAEKIHQEHGVIDLLFNNAGIGLHGDFLSIPPEIWRKAFEINVMGIVNCSNAFVPAMIARGKGGHVINTASASGYFPSDKMAPYTATKHAAVGISGCQRLEWEKHRIRVTAVCPGVINTNIVKTMMTFGSSARPGFKEKSEKIYIKRGYSPDKVAKVVLKALPKSPYILPVSPEAWLFYYATRLLPSKMIIQRMIGSMMKRRNESAAD
jgi:NAD(P)-dependent dehydrogenase (short-subunit alcohol dehydrogenase family)